MTKKTEQRKPKIIKKSQTEKKSKKVESSKVERYVKRFENIVLFGSAHVSNKTKEEVEKAIEKYKPEVVALELDQDRAEALLSNQKQTIKSYIKNFGIKGILLYYISKYQYNVALKNNTELGLEMKTAINTCSKKNIKIAFIDIPINITLNQLKKAINFKLFLKFIKELFSRRKITLSSTSDYLDLKESEIDEVIEYMRTEFPELWKILLDNRNKYMAAQLIAISNFLESNNTYSFTIETKENEEKKESRETEGNETKQNEKESKNENKKENKKTILAIVGKAHVKGIIAELKRLKNSEKTKNL